MKMFSQDLQLADVTLHAPFHNRQLRPRPYARKRRAIKVIRSNYQFDPLIMKGPWRAKNLLFTAKAG
jgi:hypothetical protein